MALLILALLQRIFLMSSLMLLLVWLIFFMVLIKLLPILGTISGKTVKLMVLALICLGNNRQDLHPPNCMLDQKSGSAGMPRPMEYPVCFSKKETDCFDGSSERAIVDSAQELGLRGGDRTKD